MVVCLWPEIASSQHHRTGARTVPRWVSGGVQSTALVSFDDALQTGWGGCMHELKGRVVVLRGLARWSSGGAVRSLVALRRAGFTSAKADDNK